MESGQGPFSVGKVFTFLLLTFGPLNVLGPFVGMTHARDSSFRRRLAREGTFVAAFAMLVAVTIGVRVLRVWDVSTGAVYVACGIVLFLIALRSVLTQYVPGEPRAKRASSSSDSASALAYVLAFPTIVTPYGIVVLVLLMTLASEQAPGQFLILAVAVVVLVLDLLTMLNAERILKGAFVPALFGMLGAMMALLQLAFAVQAVMTGLRLLRIA